MMPLGALLDANLLKTSKWNRELTKISHNGEVPEVSFHLDSTCEVQTIDPSDPEVRKGSVLSSHVTVKGDSLLWGALNTFPIGIA